MPKTVTTKADSSGNWHYTVSGLAPGTHYIQASAVDPASKQSSLPKMLLSFRATSANVTRKATQPKKSDRMTASIYYVILAALLLILAVVVWKRRLLPKLLKENKTQSHQNASSSETKTDQSGRSTDQ